MLFSIWTWGGGSGCKYILAQLKVSSLVQVGEFSTIVCTSSSDTSIVLAIFDLWIAKNGFEVGSHLVDNIPTRHLSKPQGWRSSPLQWQPRPGRTLRKNTSRRRFFCPKFQKQALTLFLMMLRKWALSRWWRRRSMWQQLTSWGRFWKACSTGWRNTSKNILQSFFENFERKRCLTIPSFLGYALNKKWVLLLQGGFVPNPDDECRLYPARCLGGRPRPGDRLLNWRKYFSTEVRHSQFLNICEQWKLKV